MSANMTIPGVINRKTIPKTMYNTNQQRTKDQSAVSVDVGNRTSCKAWRVKITATTTLIADKCSHVTGAMRPLVSIPQKGF